MANCVQPCTIYLELVITHSRINLNLLIQILFMIRYTVISKSKYGGRRKTASSHATTMQHML